MRPDRPAVPVCSALSLLLICLGATPAPAQTLVEAARLAAEARARFGPPDKVYTTADLPADARRPPAPRPAAPIIDTTQLDAALQRERLLLELLQAASEPDDAPARERHRSSDAPERVRPPTSGIPLAVAYGTPYVPFFGSRGTGSGRAVARPAGRADGAGKGRAGPLVDDAGHGADPRLAPPRPDAGHFNRNGYAESSRPFDYIAPGLPAPGARSAPPSRARP